MDNRTLMMLRVFANRFNPSAGEALLKFLPKETMQAVLNQNIRSKDLSPLLNQPHALFQHLHYTWIKPAIDQFPERLHPLFISALNSEQVSGLYQDREPIALSSPVRNFLQNLIFNFLHTEKVLPFEYLPPSDLAVLTSWNKTQLVRLIDFLGIHDLASEVRRIVNKDHLKNIYSCLTPQQYNYLSICLHQREQIVAPKLGIDPSVKGCPHLKPILHRRGLVRFGKALCGQHPDFAWYLSRIFDKGRGRVILSAYQPQADPALTALLKTQVMNLMDFLKASHT